MLADRDTHRLAFWVAAVLFVATVAQLAFGTFVPGIERFEDKAFGYRLALGTAAMVAVPVAWTVARRMGKRVGAVPWWETALIIGSFFVDAAGNSLDLYDSYERFDNLSHFLTWLLLLWGLGLLLARTTVRPRWALAAIIVGLGAVLAIGWEVGEWYTFIRRGYELDGAYEDTLSDQVLGTLGSVVAAVLVDRARHRREVGAT